jgi:hypothetical protein
LPCYQFDLLANARSQSAGISFLLRRSRSYDWHYLEPKVSARGCQGLRHGQNKARRGNVKRRLKGRVQLLETASNALSVLFLRESGSCFGMPLSGWRSLPTHENIPTEMLAFSAKFQDNGAGRLRQRNTTGTILTPALQCPVQRDSTAAASGLGPSCSWSGGV